MERIRVGLVGAGFAARYHVACLRRVYGVEVELAGVTSLRAESRSAFGAEHGIAVYDGIEPMLDAIDVLDICSPPYAHESGILAAAAADKAIICEKPLTGAFGPPEADATFRGDRAPKQPMLDEVVARLKRIAEAVRTAGVPFGYAENFVYAPSVQKEREIVEKTGAQILRMTGEESHKGSASDTYGFWRLAGGGSLIGKGCHPLAGMLYLKRVEGLARDGRPIRPATVSARTHQITRLPTYRDVGFLRTDYHDVEDCGIMHVLFEDGTVADVLTSELVLGGIYDYIEVFANNHRTRCRISPTGLVDVYNPRGDQFRDIYLVEKASTQEGWSPAAPDENLSLDLALDTTATIYAAYVSDENKGAETAIPRL